MKFPNNEKNRCEIYPNKETSTNRLCIFSEFFSAKTLTTEYREAFTVHILDANLDCEKVGRIRINFSPFIPIR